MLKQFFLILSIVFCLQVSFADEISNDTHFEICGYLGVGYLNSIYGNVFIEEDTSKQYAISNNINIDHNFRYNYVCFEATNVNNSTLKVYSVKIDETKVPTNVQSDENCHVFIDKIGVTRQTGRFTLESYYTYLKVNLDKLDGKIIKVGAARQYGETGKWHFSERLVSDASFVNSNDYFVIKSTYHSSNDLNVAFFVETQHNTRYWAKAKIDEKLVNFELHNHTYKYLNSLFGFDWDVSDLEKTADFNTYFNPFACR